MHIPPLLSDAFEQILRDQEPNFLRLYLNPHVAETCFCLDRYMRTTWPGRTSSDRRPRAAVEDCQSFLANGFEEALSGAIKLARYNQQSVGPRATCLIVDPSDRLTGFAAEELPGGDTVEFLPGIRVIGKKQLRGAPGTLDLERAMARGDGEDRGERIDPLVLVAGERQVFERHAESIRRVVQRDRPLVITCVDRATLAALRDGSTSILHEIIPDIVIFDESFVHQAVPFSAFTARKTVFAGWNRSRKATFHSTTFQPNTISTLHFMNCLAHADPDFIASYGKFCCKPALTCFGGPNGFGGTITRRFTGSFERQGS